MRKWFNLPRRRPRRVLTVTAVAALMLSGLGTAQAFGQIHLLGQSGPRTATRATQGSPGGSGTLTAARRPLNTPLTVNTNAPCNIAVGKGMARCMAVIRTPADHRVTPDVAGPPAGALGPADIQSAYKLPAGSGGNTVAIVDAFGDSNAESDLAAFRAQFGLPPCTTANGCFTKVSQRGGTDYPADNAGWALETSLDLDAVSSACPSCEILLVQADDNSFGNLSAAVQEAVSLGAKFVSNSYGTDDFSGDEQYDNMYDFPGVVVAAATGDVGNVADWPAASGKVLAVGGTTLAREAGVARGWDESAWAGGGSGCTISEPKPDFQQNVTTDCATRAEADISADADPGSGLATYDTLGQSGWLQVGGTSLATPLITAMYAMAGVPVAGTYPASYPYHDPNAGSDLFDITSGSDGSCGNLLCSAGPGWDGPTGLGAPDGPGGLTSGPHGDISGHVTDAATGKPVAGATISTNIGGYVGVTDASGAYDISTAVGTYDLTVSAYAYQSASQAGVTVADKQTTAEDFALTELPHGTVSGTVTDGSGHGWPLYAKITIDGYPGGPVYTDPFTGKYSVLLAGPAAYNVHVEPAYPAVLHDAGDGYQPQDFQLSVGGTDMTRDVALAVDTTACDAPGYGWNGLSQDFSAPPQDWTVSGGPGGWTFTNPENRSPAPGGDDHFALADSTTGQRVDTTLTSPAVNLGGQPAPHLTFDSAYYAGRGSSATVQVSTDGGQSWSTIWRRTSINGIGQVDLPIPAAAQVQVRFRYTGRDAWWWAVDDVLAGTRTCVPIPGGLVSGLVTDQATSAGINGTVISGPGGQYTYAAETGDPNLPPFYLLFVPGTGAQPLIAIAAGYAPANANVTITPDQITRYDWALTAAGGN
jgi:Carboxypeptidase regulatory-like domain/Subtilase family